MPSVTLTQFWVLWDSGMRSVLCLWSGTWGMVQLLTHPEKICSEKSWIFSWQKAVLLNDLCLSPTNGCCSVLLPCSSLPLPSPHFLLDITRAAPLAFSCATTHHSALSSLHSVLSLTRNIRKESWSLGAGDPTKPTCGSCDAVSLSRVKEVALVMQGIDNIWSECWKTQSDFCRARKTILCD